MVELYAPKSQAHRVGKNIEDVMKKIEHLWEQQGFSKEETIFWNKIRNQLGVMVDTITRAYRKQ